MASLGLEALLDETQERRGLGRNGKDLAPAPILDTALRSLRP
jgi:hypothetical protein